nr:hypothetical protein [Bradyrhizobium diazoefficiens]
MAEQRWRIRLGGAAELDFANILKWTTENFGPRQSRIYRNTLIQAIAELARGPDVAGARVFTRFTSRDTDIAEVTS